MILLKDFFNKCIILLLFERQEIQRAGELERNIFHLLVLF